MTNVIRGMFPPKKTETGPSQPDPPTPDYQALAELFAQLAAQERSLDEILTFARATRLLLPLIRLVELGFRQQPDAPQSVQIYETNHPKPC